MSGVEIDFETKSAVELRTRGVYNYMDSPTTEPLMASYSIDGGPIQRWRPSFLTLSGPCPDDLREAIESGATISAHNAGFERLLMQRILAVRYGWPMPQTRQFRCTAATAAALGLPRALDDLGAALGLTIQKDKIGKSLINKFSKPRKARKGEDPAGLYFNEPWEFPEDFERFHDYCDVDVRVEALADRRMVRLSDAEQAIYTMSEVKNDRGVRIDLTSARSALALAEAAKRQYDREIRKATGGYVGAATQVSKLVEWVEMQGVAISSGQKAEIEELLELEDLPAHVRQAVQIRQDAAKSSVSKLKAMIARASSDGRVRGTSIYHAASTGREQSVGVNFNNLPRPRKLYEDAHIDTSVLFEAIRTEDPDYLRLLYGDKLGKPLHLLSDAIRGFIWAGPDHDLLQADYSGIEGAVIAWSSGEDWKVKAMHAIIANPLLPDMYRRTAAGILNLPIEVVTKKHWARQAVGKVSELACFTAETRVLTRRGVKSIVEVLPDDLLWDGVEWVRHQGLIAKGVRQVVDVDGIGVTPDHLILTGKTWRPAQELVSNPSMLGQALATGLENSPYWGSKQAPQAACAARPFNVLAAPSPTRLTFTISEKALARAAMRALGKRRIPPVKSILATTMSCLTTITAIGCSAASRLASTVAPTPMTAATLTMADVAFPCIGETTAGRSSLTLSRSTVGISRNWNSIASRSTRTTNPEICASSPEPSTRAIGEKRGSCRLRSARSSRRTTYSAPVFDILQAGSRNRFLILSDSGSLIAHNCGFGGGVMAFVSMSKNYNVKLDPLFENVWATADEERRAKAMKRHAGALKRGKEGADVLSREAWLACELIKVGWRATNPAIAKGWHLREDAVRDAIRNPGQTFEALKFKYVVKLGYLWCMLPSGRCLAYAKPKLRDQVWAELKLDDGTWGDSEVMDRLEAEALALKGLVQIKGKTSPAITALGVGKDGKMRREFLYGGILGENDTQAVARDLLENGKKKAEAHGYPVVATVYDELITEVPRGFGDLEAFERLICELPAWAEGMPLTAGGWRGKRYRKD